MPCAAQASCNRPRLDASELSSMRTLTTHRPVNALGWLVVAAMSAFALAREVGAALASASGSAAWMGLVAGVFVLLLGAIGVVRCAAGRLGAAHRRWLGLPDRDWAFAGTFAVLSGTMLWWAAG